MRPVVGAGAAAPRRPPTCAPSSIPRGNPPLHDRGIDVERPREAEMAAQSLAFPVFAPFDPRLPARASPLLRSLQRAAFDDEAMAALFSRCDASGDCAGRKRERMAAQLRALEAAAGADEPGGRRNLPYHIGASGPFHLADSDTLHVTLENLDFEVAKAKGARSRPMCGTSGPGGSRWPERSGCSACSSPASASSARSGTPKRAPRPATGDDAFESLVALFARRDGNTRCVRRLFNALASAGEDSGSRCSATSARCPAGEEPRARRCPGSRLAGSALLPQGPSGCGGAALGRGGGGWLCR